MKIVYIVTNVSLNHVAMRHPALLLLVLFVLCGFTIESRAQQRDDKYAAFTLTIRITSYDESDEILSVESATRYQSSCGDWRYTYTFGKNTFETVHPVGHGVYVGNSVSKRLIKVSDQENGCPTVTAENLILDPKFVRTASVRGFTAYVLREQSSKRVMETYYVPELGRTPFKRTYVFEDGHKLVEEPVRISMDEPTKAELAGPDYERIEQKPIFIDNLKDQVLTQPPPVYPDADRNTPVNITVQVIVDTTGRVISAGPITPIPSFDVAAVEAAFQATLSPVIIEGKPVVVTGCLTYTFDPRRKTTN